MLTLTALTDAEYLISSVALSIDEYYAGVGESPGVWAGKWAEELRLSGVVEADELRALVEGRRPGDAVPTVGGEPGTLGAGFRYDLFGAQERLAAVGLRQPSRWPRWWPPPTGRPSPRRWRSWRNGPPWPGYKAGGVRRRVETDGWVVAGFGHRTSREGDPQLHSHCLVPNLVRRKSDGRYVALDAGPLFDWCRAAGSVYQNQLQRSLSLRLGVAWGPDRHNTREMHWLQPCAAAGVLQAQRPDRGRAGGQGCAL